MEHQKTVADIMDYEKVLESKFQELTDLRQPPLVATLTLSEQSILPTKLFFYLDSSIIPPLVKLLPHKYLHKSFSEVFDYLSNSERDTRNQFEAGFSETLRNSMELARTQDYGMQISLQAKNIASSLSPDYNAELFEFLKEKKAKLNNHSIELNRYKIRY